MSIQTLYTAATGMESLQTKLDVIANNLANVNTGAFKKDRANFEDLFYRHEVLPGALDANNNATAVGVEIGLGSRVSSTQTDFRQGAFQQTSRDLDVAIEGPGFFPVKDSSGEIMYTRAGNFSRNADGKLVMGSASTGRPLDPEITIPPDATAVSITPQGQVSYRKPGQTGLTVAGQIQLAMFVNPEGLLKNGENLYSVTGASGAAVLGNPGSSTGQGLLHQSELEASNVEPVQELIDLISTQRAFELNSQAVQAGDQILQQIGNLRRG